MNALYGQGGLDNVEATNIMLLHPFGTFKLLAPSALISSWWWGVVHTLYVIQHDPETGSGHLGHLTWSTWSDLGQ